RIQEFRDLTSRFQSLIQSDQLSVRIVDGRMVVTLGSDVLFPSGSSKLSAEGTKAIQTVAQTLSTIPNRSYQVEGHTDNVPIRTALFPSNWELAAARAISVSRTMVEAGLDPARVSAASFGEFKPIKANDTPEGRTQNRRIEIVIVPDLSLLPGYDELSRIKSAE
ncbi:MAG: OmpA family protein, partial [Bdellovibrionales bacterium]|nr:OmpA family protein [Bdellovibrionales bacterium]